MSHLILQEFTARLTDHLLLAQVLLFPAMKPEDNKA